MIMNNYYLIYFLNTEIQFFNIILITLIKNNWFTKSTDKTNFFLVRKFKKPKNNYVYV